MTPSIHSPLHQTVSTTATDYWNDSCAVEELTYAIGHGAVGATSNPTIVHEVLLKEKHRWSDRIREIARSHATWSERDVTWQLIREMAVQGAKLLEPVFERERGLKGRLSIQTDPALYRDADAIVEQAVELAALAPNMQVKIPVTQAGVSAIEEATCRGVNINSTVCFTVAQAVAAAEAVERGLERRAQEGLDISRMSPVCTIMVGRLDDWLKIIADKRGIIVTPGTLDWAGVACLKRAYGVFRERGLRPRLLAAAYRSHLHWSELVGGNVVLTIPYAWQRKFNASDVEVRPRMDAPVPRDVLAQLAKLDDFRAAYEPDGLAIGEFDSYGATRRTLRGFLQSFYDLVAEVRNIMLPDPDTE